MLAPDLPTVAGLTVAERAEVGKAARKQRPRRSYGDWAPAPGRPDPIALLEAQAADRVADLLPLRHARMAASPFAFYRGAATVMAHDLGVEDHSGLIVQLCGDAHLANVGGFASPERTLVFDINDFDETHPGPFEWDVQRLCASVELCARSIAVGPDRSRELVAGTARAYREAMAAFAAATALDVFYRRVGQAEVEAIWHAQADARSRRRLDKVVSKGEAKDRLRAQAKLTEVVDGHRRFREEPPLLVRASTLAGAAGASVGPAVDRSLDEYRDSLQPASRRLLDRYARTDLARKVVGVGSVGTRAWVALFEGRDDADPLFLQVKEAVASVLEPFTGTSPYADHGRRVVEGQRLIQAGSDVLLGWARGSDLFDGAERHYYVRQLWDWKTTADFDRGHGREVDLRAYADLCGRVLARAHARSGDPVAIDAYLGRSERFDRSMAEFARTYADRNDADHRLLLDAVADGRLPSADTDVADGGT